jgi:hypothetical protein
VQPSRPDPGGSPIISPETFKAKGSSRYLPLTIISFAELNLLAATASKKNANAYEHALNYAITGI